MDEGDALQGRAARKGAAPGQGARPPRLPGKCLEEHPLGAARERVAMGAWACVKEACGGSMSGQAKHAPNSEPSHEQAYRAPASTCPSRGRPISSPAKAMPLAGPSPRRLCSRSRAARGTSPRPRRSMCGGAMRTWTAPAAAALSSRWSHTPSRCTSPDRSTRPALS
jgi:hypothetical protein